MVKALLAALQMLAARPGRAASTGAGVSLGVAAFVCTMGLSATVGQQVSDAFDVHRATTVIATAGAAGRSGPDTAGTEPLVDQAGVDRLRGMEGVVDAAWQGTVAQVELGAQTVPGRWNDNTCQVKLILAGPRFLETIGARVDGLLFTAADDAGLRHSAIVGTAAASRCALAVGSARVMLAGRSYAVLGELAGADRVQGLSDSLIVAAGAVELSGTNAASDSAALSGIVIEEQVVIHTEPGAAGVIGGSAAVAVLPTNPDAVVVAHAPDPKELRQSVNQSMATLGLLASAAVLVGGVFAVGNLMMLNVIQRRSEFGMRRAVGATGYQVLSQVLIEAGLVGAIAAGVGVLLAAWGVYATCLVQGWRPVLDWELAGFGAAVGVGGAMLGGLIPAVVAARARVADSLRR
ncbi:MAG: ABC transporter permease [Propionibacteriaceae bacterium]|nr:ABC transporter permease [Propionibacteriaceae bacterium]